MDVAEATVIAGVAGFIALSVLCLSISFGEGLGRTRWPLAIALVMTVLLGAFVTGVLLVASRHGVHSVEMDAPVFGTASAARAYGLASLSATLVAVAALAAALVARRPRLATASLASAAAALFVPSVAAGWWANVEHWAG